MDYQSKSTEELERLRRSISSDLKRSSNAYAMWMREFAIVNDEIAKRKAELEAEKEGVANGHS